jgi:regulator of sigma E protease
MLTVVQSIVWGIITISILVFVHEGGHFLAARACGLEVEEFMIGLPGPKISKVWGKTRYGITAIPFGGYCKIPALEGEGSGLAAELGAGTLPADAPKVPAWKKIIVLSAGIIVNLVMAIAIFTIVLTGWGTLTDHGNVDPAAGGPAAAAGLQDGDDIVAINGKTVEDFEDLVTIIDALKVGDTATVTYVRPSDVDGTLTITLAVHPDDAAKAYLGVQPHYVMERVPFFKALKMSFGYLNMTAEAIAQLFHPSTFKQTISQSSSVIGISVIAAEAAAAGPLQYASLVAAISLSLGLMNLLPLPPLDGGKILIELIQLITRRPLKQNIVIAVSLAGFGVLFAFMLFVMYNDVARMIG